MQRSFSHDRFHRLSDVGSNRRIGQSRLRSALRPRRKIRGATQSECQLSMKLPRRIAVAANFRNPPSVSNAASANVAATTSALGWDQSFPCPMRTAGSSAYHLFAIASILRTPPMSATRAATAASRPVGGRRLWAVLATANVSNALWFSPTHAKRRIGRNGSTGR